MIHLYVHNANGPTCQYYSIALIRLCVMKFRSCDTVNMLVRA